MAKCFLNSGQAVIRIKILKTCVWFPSGAVPWGGGGKGGKSPLKISKKGKIKKYGVFLCIKVIKISFSVIFNEEICALEGLLS